jgi:hypothetical protein
MKNRLGAFLFPFILLLLNATIVLAQKQGNDISTNSDGSITRGGITVPAEKVKPVKVPRFDKPPTIDGNIDEEVWKQAAIFKDFVQTSPGDNIAPSKPTEAMIGYDDRNLYFAFHCYDDKDKIRATVAARDQVFGEDNVRIFLDTFNDQRRAYILGFNPLGIQQDGIMTDGQGQDYSVDIVMESKGIIVEDGWTLEVKIPFKSLRYQAGKGKFWGIHIQRNIDRFSDEIDSWMPTSRNISGFLNQAGQITGLEEISTERTLEIIPSLTLKETGELQPGGKFSNPAIQPDAGVTIKYSITPNVTLDAALNPDFADVEADAPVVEANQRFPIFFEEKRPFFLEGVDIFQTPIQAVYTRRVVDPDIAAKLTGKIGRNSFGFLYASDRLQKPKYSDPNATITITRLKRDIGKESNIGVLATTYNYIIPRNNGVNLKRHNYLGGVDGRFKLDKQTVLTFQALMTNTKNFFFDPALGQSVYRSGNGFAYNVRYDYTSKYFGYQIGSGGRTRDYRADVGFTRRTNNMNHYIGARFSSEPKPKATIIEKRLFTSIGMNNDFQGRIQSWGHESNLNFRMQRNIFIEFGYNVGYDRIFEEEFGKKRNAAGTGGTFFGAPERSTYNGGWFGGGDANLSKKISLFLFGGMQWNEFDFDFGAGPRFQRVSPVALNYFADPNRDPKNPPPLDPGAGRSMFIDAGFEVKPVDELEVSFGYSKNNLIRNDTKQLAFDSNIYSFRSTYKFTRFVFARAIVDYSTIEGNWRGQYLFGWTPNPGTALYIGYNDDLNYKGYNRFTDVYEQGFRLYRRTFFIKMSYLIRKSF